MENEEQGTEIGRAYSVWRLWDDGEFTHEVEIPPERGSYERTREKIEKEIATIKDVKNWTLFCRDPRDFRVSFRWEFTNRRIGPFPSYVDIAESIIDVETYLANGDDPGVLSNHPTSGGLRRRYLEPLTAS